MYEHRRLQASLAGARWLSAVAFRGSCHLPPTDYAALAEWHQLLNDILQTSVPNNEAADHISQQIRESDTQEEHACLLRYWELTALFHCPERHRHTSDSPHEGEYY
eukprot:scaffold154352_cov38-Prasinocladus_malaysianus.AAC.1